MSSQGRGRLLFIVVLLVAAGVGVFVATRDGDDGDEAGGHRELGRLRPGRGPGAEEGQVPQARAGAGARRAGDGDGRDELREFVIDLDTTESPKTANSFAFLAEEGFYDGTVFHRIAPGFVIQGGDPTGTGSGGPGYTVTEPPPEDTTYETGLVAMAKTAVEPPGASGSQFFVVTAPADAGLPPDYAVLGKVGEGMDVVDAIGELGDPQEQPTQVVTIDSVTIDSG